MADMHTRTTNATSPEAVQRNKTAEHEELKDASKIPGLKPIKGKRWGWPNVDAWQPLDGGSISMTAKEQMALTADAEGNWFLEYDIDNHVRAHAWMYRFEARTKHGTPLFSLTPKPLDRGTGGFHIVQTGRSVHIRRDFEHIQHWVRIGHSGAVRHS